MPSIVVYTNDLTPGIAQMPVFSVGDDQNWSITFNNGVSNYNPTGVTMRIGYITGLADGTYTSAFQWVDRLANQHIGSFVITSGVPGSLTWDENPIGVTGTDGAYLVLGRTPPSSQIRKVNIVSGGTGLSTAPKLRFVGGTTETGQRAVGTATVGAGDVTGITITDGGRGYSATNPPEVIITGDGTGSVWKVNTATMVAGVIGTLAKVTVGTGYTTATVYIVDPEATATATVGGSSAVTAVALTVGGAGYTSAPTVAITGGGGASATATAALLNSTWGVAGLTITNPGTGYTSVPTVSFSGGTGSGVAATASVSLPSTVQTVTITNAGSGYTSGNETLTFSGGGGSGAAGYAVPGGIQDGDLYGKILTIVITNPGAGYTSTPTVTFPAPTLVSGTQATGTVVMGNGTITGLTLTNSGSGYGATAPTVAFTGGGGSSAAATASLIGSPVGSLTLTAGGSGYTSAPVLGFSGGAGTGAAGIATVSLGITAVTMVQPGYAYTSQPKIALEPTANGAVLEAAGIETYDFPFIRNATPIGVNQGVSAVPWTHDRRDSNGDLVYDDSLLLIRPQTLLSPTLTLQADALTWAGVFTPVVRYVTAVLNFRQSVVVDVQIFGGGRLLLSAPLTIKRA
jgi:hypothetical protein